jgi:hypothetical protein
MCTHASAKTGTDPRRGERKLGSWVHRSFRRIWSNLEYDFVPYEAIRSSYSWARHRAGLFV